MTSKNTSICLQPSRSKAVKQSPQLHTRRGEFLLIPQIFHVKETSSHIWLGGWGSSCSFRKTQDLNLHHHHRRHHHHHHRRRRGCCCCCCCCWRCDPSHSTISSTSSNFMVKGATDSPSSLVPSPKTLREVLLWRQIASQNLQTSLDRGFNPSEKY